MNMDVRISLWQDLEAIRYMPRNGKTGSDGASILSFWGNLHTDFYYGASHLSTSPSVMRNDPFIILHIFKEP